MAKQDKERKDSAQENQTENTDEKSQQNNNTDSEASPEQTSGETANNQEDILPQNDQEQQEDQADEKELMIKSLQEQNSELNDKFLRLFSEFDNFRKRTLKEKQELTKTASADIIEAILPVVDDLERAYKSAIENPEMETITEGLNLIQTKLKTTLKHKGLEEIPSVGEVFNTDFHEAITHIPAPNKEDKGKVIEEVQKGYTLNGKVLRFAKVVVAN